MNTHQNWPAHLQRRWTLEVTTVSQESLPAASVRNKASATCSIIPDGMFGARTSDQWIAKYARSHQHPVNRVCHTYGIPTILLSLVLFGAALFYHRMWWYALILFITGWLLQFVGHAFEGKPPEFFQDWRFLFVGVRWWWAKINGRV